MSAYVSFFLNSPSSVVHVETIEVAHPSFSKTYWVVRNAMFGLTATLETGAQQDFEYYPLGISSAGASDDLDQTLTVTLGDLGQMIPQEIDRYLADRASRLAAFLPVSKPSLTYRVFRSDDLSAPMDGPFIYEVSTNASKKKAQTLTAGAPRLNLNQTGESYRMNRFPMMRGFL
jgi:hypothetical protein